MMLPTLRALDAELERRLRAPTEKELSLDALPALARVADRMEPKMRKEFLRVIEAMRAVDLETLAAALQAGHASAVDAALGLDTLTADLGRAWHDTLVTTFLAGATVGHDVLAQMGVTMRFDLINPHAVAYARTDAATMVTAISDETRLALRDAVEATIAGQAGDWRDLARQIRPLIGLDERRLNAVEAFRARLTEDGMRQDVLDARVSRYATAQLRNRAETISRTETVSAASAGQQGLWDEAVRQGQLSPTALKRKWIATEDELLCPICEDLDSQEPVGMNEPWHSRVSGQDYMRPTAHPRCRCSMGLVEA